MRKGADPPLRPCKFALGSAGLDPLSGVHSVLSGSNARRGERSLVLAVSRLAVIHPHVFDPLYRGDGLVPLMLTTTGHKGRDWLGMYWPPLVVAWHLCARLGVPAAGRAVESLGAQPS